MSHSNRFVNKRWRKKEKGGKEQKAVKSFDNNDEQ